MKVNIVPRGPGQATENHDREGQPTERADLSQGCSSTVNQPAYQKWQHGSQRWIRQKRPCPKKTIENEIAPLGRIFQCKGGPQQTRRKQNRERGVPNPLKWQKDAAGKNRPDPTSNGSYCQATHAFPRKKQWNRRGCGKKAVQQNGGGEGLQREYSEQPENASD